MKEEYLISVVGRLRERFDVRWRRLRKKSVRAGLNLPRKDLLWKKLLRCYRSGFECEYCGEQLLIKDSRPPYSRSFSLDHKTSIDLGGDNSLSNFAIVCYRCNILKGTMTAETYQKLLNSLNRSSKKYGTADWPTNWKEKTRVE